MLETPLLQQQPYADLFRILNQAYMNSTQYHIDSDSDSDDCSNNEDQGDGQDDDGDVGDAHSVEDRPEESAHEDTNETDHKESPKDTALSENGAAHQLEAPEQTIPQAVESTGGALPKGISPRTIESQESVSTTTPGPGISQERGMTEAPVTSSTKGDTKADGNLTNGVYYICNVEHDNGITCPNGTIREPITGTFMDEAVEGGGKPPSCKWRVTRYKKSQKYFIYNIGHDMWTGDRSGTVVSIKTGQIRQWVIQPAHKPTKEGEVCYTIKHFEDDRFWGLSDSLDLSNVTLRNSKEDTQNHWTFEKVSE